jgi:hypothetical protein
LALNLLLHAPSGTLILERVLPLLLAQRFPGKREAQDRSGSVAIVAFHKNLNLTMKIPANTNHAVRF